MIKVDMHVHTTCSHDAMIDLDTLIKKCNEKQIIPIITDHDTFDAITKLKKRKFRFIPGEEIKTSQGELIGLFIKKKIIPGMTFKQTLKEIKKQGGLSYCPHPFDNIRKGILDPTLIKQCDIIEVYNSRSVFNSMNEKANKLADQYNITKGVGSDAHYPFEIGTSYVEMNDFNTQKQFLTNLKKANLIKRKTTIFVHGTFRFYKLYNKIKRMLKMR